MKDFLSLIPKIKKGITRKNSFNLKGFFKNGKNLFFFVPFLFFFVFLNLFIEDNNSKLRTIEKTIQGYPLSIPSPALYPFKSLVLGKTSYVEQSNKVDNGLSDVSAKAVIVMDDDSKVIVFSKNENLRFSTASTAKIMTALIALEHFRMDDILTIQQDVVEGSTVGFKKGEKITLESLLYGMLLPSGNDAALAIAQNYPGGKEAFIKKMNENAEAFNLYNTHFSDPSGLLDDEDYTSALDLARLASTALKNETFAKIVATKQKVISNIEGDNKYSVSNLNKLLGFDGINGIKTGFTDGAGGVLVTSKIKEEPNGAKHRLIIVVMKSEDRFWDTQKILYLIDSRNLEYKNF